MRLPALAVLITLAAAAPAHAAWTPSTLTSSPGRNLEPIQSAIGPDGTAALAWVERDLRNPPVAWIAVRAPGQDFRAPIALATTGEQPSVAVAPDGTAAVVVPGNEGLALGVVPPGANQVAWRTLPGTAGAHSGLVAIDGAGNATVTWRPTAVPPEGQPALFALSITASGIVSAPQPLDDRLPSDGWLLRVAPTGQAAILWNAGRRLAYRPSAAAPFEPTITLTRDAYGARGGDIAFDKAGTLFLTLVESPVDGGDESFRSGVRPAGGALALSASELTTRWTTTIAVDPAGGAQAACDCGTDGGLHTRAVTPALSPPTKELAHVGTLNGWAIGPDGTRLALWQKGTTGLIGTRPSNGTWTVAPFETNGGLYTLAVGPFGEAIVAYGAPDANSAGRLRVLVSGSASARAGGGGPADTGAPARVPARAALGALVQRLRSGIASDRRRIARRRSVTPARRATTTLRRATTAVKPDSTATRRARRALLRGLDHRARALKHAQRGNRRAARRLLTTASRDARTAAKHLTGE